MIESIDRALAVLQLFLKEERPLSVTRISKVMELHKKYGKPYAGDAGTPRIYSKG